MRKDLGKPEQLTGTIQKCVLADGSVVEANVTEDDVDTAYYAVVIVFIKLTVTWRKLRLVVTFGLSPETRQNAFHKKV